MCQWAYRSRPYGPTADVPRWRQSRTVLGMRWLRVLPGCGRVAVDEGQLVQSARHWSALAGPRRRQAEGWPPLDGIAGRQEGPRRGMAVLCITGSLRRVVSCGFVMLAPGATLHWFLCTQSARNACVSIDAVW